VHFASGKAAENNWLTNEDVGSTALYIGSGLSILLLLAIVFFFGKKEKREFDSKSLTYAAICIAMSFALSFLRIVRLPQGGSITPASLLPLMLYAYMFGVRKGVFAGFIYGLLQAFQDPALLHPAQFLLDYPVAFAWIGLAGVFSQSKTLSKLPQSQFALGAALAGIGRFLMHFLSGTFAFGVFAPEGTPVALYSFVYQAGYVLPDLVIAIAVGILLFSSKAFVKETRKFHLKEA
jgi:thiamine transporter